MSLFSFLSLPPEIVTHICNFLDVDSMSKLRRCSSRARRCAMQTGYVAQVSGKIVRFRALYTRARCLWVPEVFTGGLGASPTRHAIYGASGHSFRRPSPLTWQDVMRAEKDCGPLPYEYRRFVTECGAPKTTDMKMDEHVSDRGMVLCGCSGFGIYRQPIKWDASLRREDRRWASALEISTSGCNYATLLLLTGEEEGMVCVFDMERNTPVAYYDSFLNWINGWLDDVIQLMTEDIMSEDEV